MKKSKEKSLESSLSGENNAENVIIVDNAKPAKKKKPKKVLSKKRRIFNLIVIGVLGVFSGFLLGNFYVNNFMGGIDYSQYSEISLRDNESMIISRFGSTNTANLSGVNAFIIAESKFLDKENVSMNADGYIDAMGVKQDLLTKKYKVNDSYFVENISKGQVILGIDTNIAERNYYDSTTDVLKVYKGKDVQQTSTTFSELKEELSLSEWKEKNGTTPLNFHPYIVSSKTIVSATNPKSCTLDSGDSGYIINFSLQPISSFLYVKQIKNLSGLGDYPEFVSINLEVFLNLDGTFNKIVTKEEYKVKKLGMKVSTYSNITYIFSYEASEIPSM